MEAGDLTHITREEGGQGGVVVGEKDSRSLSTDLQHDVSPACSTSDYDDGLPPEVLRPPVVVAVEDPAGEQVDVRDVGDDGDRVVAVTHHHGVVSLDIFFLQKYLFEESSSLCQKRLPLF